MKPDAASALVSSAVRGASADSSAHPTTASRHKKTTRKLINRLPVKRGSRPSFFELRRPPPLAFHGKKMGAKRETNLLSRRSKAKRSRLQAGKGPRQLGSREWSASCCVFARDSG